MVGFTRKILRLAYTGGGVAFNWPLRTPHGPPPDPGGAPTADFSVATNSQLIAVLMGDF